MLGRKHVIVVTVALVCVPTLHAQTSRVDPVDFQTRYSAGVALNLPKKWEASVDYEVRMVSDASEYRGSYLSGEIGRPVFSKHFSLFTNYRYARVTDGSANRFGFGAQYERKLRKVNVSFRPMWEYQASLSDDDEPIASSKSFLRTRLRAKLPLTKRVAVYGSAEPYFTFTGDYPIDNWRNSLGTELQVVKHQKVNLYYIYRPDYAKTYNRTYHIVGAAYTVELKLPR